MILCCHSLKTEVMIVGQSAETLNVQAETCGMIDNSQDVFKRTASVVLNMLVTVAEDGTL